MCNVLEVRKEDQNDFVHTLTLRRGVTAKQIRKAFDAAIAEKAELVNWSLISSGVELKFKRLTYRESRE
jgi:hypothetical protein